MENLSDYIDSFFSTFFEKNMKRILIFLFALMIGMTIGVSGVKAATIDTSPTPAATPKAVGSVPIYIGTVTQTPDLAITITDANGQTQSFKVNAKTTVEAPTITSLKAKATLKSIAAGDQVAIVSSDQSTTGLIVLTVKAGAKPAVNDTAFLGVVSSRDATSSGTILSLKHPKQDTFAKALVTANTKVLARDIAKPTIDDIKAGDKVLVTGPIDNNNLVTALNVFLIPGKARALIDKLAPLATQSATGGAQSSSAPKRTATSSSISR